MCIILADCVDLDILRIIDIDKFFVNVRPIGTRESEVLINFAGFVADLKKEQSEINIEKMLPGEGENVPCGTDDVRALPGSRCTRYGPRHSQASLRTACA